MLLRLNFFKYLLFFMITVVINSCQKTMNNNNSEIYEIIGQKFLDSSISKKIKTNGIAYEEFSDYKYFIKYLKREKTNFNKLPNNAIDIIFNDEEVDFFIKQLNDDNFNIEDLKFLNNKLKIYKNLEFDRHKFYKINVSKPIYSKDGNKSFIFSCSSHLTYLNSFNKDIKNKWTLNSSFLVE